MFLSIFHYFLPLVGEIRIPRNPGIPKNPQVSSAQCGRYVKNPFFLICEPIDNKETPMNCLGYLPLAYRALFLEGPIHLELSWTSQFHRTCLQQICGLCLTCIHLSSPLQVQLPSNGKKKTSSSRYKENSQSQIPKDSFR